MFNVGGGELLVILLIALIVLGPERLPRGARQMGRALGELRRISSSFQQELREAIEDDPSVGGRRTETVPLGATVADAQRPGGRATGTGGSDRSRPALAPVGDGDDGPAVPPAVAAAIEEVTTPPAADPGPASPPAGAGDDVGDERAAS
ncbi:MAG TPA: Sec-independent protein translocase protein TatB [Acidimicrobiales bacterium]|jgi:sec-independent protein translocase protein TatB|nr:Sec-independent protein translocase protein TatB [Acidimicrobiales bacterium]